MSSHIPSSYRLFLDDERHPKDVTWIELPPGPWVIVRSYAQFVDVLRRLGLPTHVSFDHDLADEHYVTGHVGVACDYDKVKEKTGYHCAQYLIDYCLDHDLPPPFFTIHSMNPIGGENIRSLLNSFLGSQDPS